MESTSKAQIFKSTIEELDTHPEFSNDDVQILANTVFANPDYLNLIDQSILSRIEAKLLKAGITKDEKIITIIHKASDIWRNDLNKLSDEVSFTANFLKKIGALKNDEWVRIYYNRVTGTNHIAVQRPISPWEQLKLAASTTLYGYTDSPADVINFLVSAQVDLYEKVQTLMKELRREGVSADDLNKGLELLTMLHDQSKIAMKGLQQLQKGSLYSDSQSFLLAERATQEIDNFRKQINLFLPEINELIFFALEGKDENQLKMLKESYYHIKNQSQLLEGESINASEIFREEKYIKDFSFYLSQHASIIDKTVNFSLKEGIKEDLKFFESMPVKINGKITNQSIQNLCEIIDETIENPICTQMIGKMISDDMFENLISIVENNLTIKLSSQLRKSAEVNFDIYGNVEIVLKMASEISPMINDEVSKEFVVVKRSIEMPLEQFKLLSSQHAGLISADFKIVDFISPKISLDQFEFVGQSNQNLISPLLGYFNPSWGAISAKALTEGSKTLKEIDDAQIFKDVFMGIQVELAPAPIKGIKEGQTITYMLPHDFAIDLPRFQIFKLNDETIYSNFQPNMSDTCLAYEKMSKAFGENPNTAIIAPKVGMAHSQGTSADLVSKMAFDEKGDPHFNTWSNKGYYITFDGDILTIENKAISYETVFSEGDTGEPNVVSAVVIYRKFQMPIVELKAAIANDNANLIVHLVAEHKISPNIFIFEDNQNGGISPKILNSNQHAFQLSKKDAFEILDNFH
ncbi:MAG: hypothetical protein H0T62_05015 [Parachlamydiaceae bacterium]|nr:hypothetical protein [Parachlamydiaceae bacterium]